MPLAQGFLLQLSVAKQWLEGLLGLILRPTTADRSSEEARARERHRRLVLTSLSSALAKVISVATSLISVPLTLHYLGAERYGVWLTISSLTAMLSFADLGLGNGVLNRVAAAYGRGDRQAILQYVSSAFAVLTPIGLVVLGTLLAGGLFQPWSYLFNIRGELARKEVGAAMAAFSACFAVAIPAGVVQRVQMALQQGFVSGLWQCASSLFALAGLLLAIHFRASLPWLVLALLGAPSVAALCNSVLFFCGQQPDLAPRFAAVSRGAVMDIGRTGFLFFILQAVSAIAYATDTVIVARALGAANVPTYGVPAQLFALIPMLLSMVLAPLWPAYGEAIARRDHAWVRSTLKRSLTLSVGFAATMSLGLLIAAPLILRVWVGHAVSAPFLLLLGLAVWRTIEAASNALAMFLNGANVIRFQVLVATLTGVCALTLKLLFVRVFGVSGPPWAGVIAYALCGALPLYIYIHKRFAGADKACSA